MLKIAVGHSEDVQAGDAVKEVLDQFRTSLAGLEPQAGILFCSVDFEHAVILASIREAFPAIELVGCTSDGELSSLYGFTEDSLTLIVFVSDTIEIRADVGRDATLYGEQAGRNAAAAAKKRLKRHQKDERFAIILADPLNAGFSHVEKGIQATLGATFPIIGGAGAAHSKLNRTYQFYNDEVLTDSVVLLLFAGPIAFSCGIQGRLSPMGRKEVVTSVKENVLYRIADQSALEYFRHYTGNQYNLFMNYCLAVYEDKQDSFYVRSILFADPESGSVTLNGHVPEGAMVQIGNADKEKIVQSCTDSICGALASYPGSQPAAALLISCAGRKMMMGTQIVQEVEIARRYLGDIPFCGFYSYGEFGPLGQGKRSLFHGATFVTLLFGPTD